MLCVSAFAATAFGQLTVENTYSGIGRPLWVQVSRPDRSRIPLEIELITPDGKTFALSTVKTGRLDLARAFPQIWTRRFPALLYAQLRVGEDRIGAPVVLQPMLNPPLSRLAADGKTVEFVPYKDGPLFNGIRAYTEKRLVFETSMGEMEFRLRPDAAPNTAWTILQLAEGGFYTNVIFHRVVAKRADGSPFVIQGGDPTGTGSGGPGFAYPLEKSTLPHDFGVISIARSTDPNTNGSQIFVCLSRAGTQHLDGRYAAFGEAVRGAETLLSIAAVPVGAQDRPTDPPVIRAVRVVPAPPFGKSATRIVRP